MGINYDVTTFISKYLYFKKAIFVDIIKTLTVFIKEFFQHSGKVQRIGSYVSKCSLYMYFLIYQNLLISGKKSLMSAELKRCVT